MRWTLPRKVIAFSSCVSMVLSVSISPVAGFPMGETAAPTPAPSASPAAPSDSSGSIPIDLLNADAVFSTGRAIASFVRGGHRADGREVLVMDEDAMGDLTQVKALHESLRNLIGSASQFQRTQCSSSASHASVHSNGSSNLAVSPAATKTKDAGDSLLEQASLYAVGITGILGHLFINQTYNSVSITTSLSLLIHSIRINTEAVATGDLYQASNSITVRNHQGGWAELQDSGTNPSEVSESRHPAINNSTNPIRYVTPGEILLVQSYNDRPGSLASNFQDLQDLSRRFSSADCQAVPRVKAWSDLVNPVITRLLTVSPNGQTLLQQATLTDNLISYLVEANALVLQVHIEYRGGILRSRGSLWYSLGYPGATRVGAGLVATFRLTEFLEITTPLVDGIIRCATPLTNLTGVFRQAQPHNVNCSVAATH